MILHKAQIIKKALVQKAEKQIRIEMTVLKFI